MARRVIPATINTIISHANMLINLPSIDLPTNPELITTLSTIMETVENDNEAQLDETPDAYDSIDWTRLP